MKRVSIVLVVLVCIWLGSSFDVEAGPYYEPYAEGWGSGWGSWSWGCSLLETTALSFKGTKSMKVTYTSQWGGFGLGSGQNFSTTGYSHLVFAFYSTLSGNNLWAYMRRASDGATTYVQIANYTETLQIHGNKWNWVRIPIVDFGLGSAPIISDFGFQSGSTNSVVYYDEINFAASVTVYEGVQAEKGPGTQLYYWNSTWSQLSSAGDYWLQVTPTAPWGGVQLQLRASGILSSSYGGLVFMFRTTSASQTLHVSITNYNGNVVGSAAVTNVYMPLTLSIQPNTWYRIVIPLSDLFSGNISLGGVAFESSTTNTFQIDDVRFIQKLTWPRMDGVRSVNYLHEGGSFGDHWENLYCTQSGLTTKRLLHNGTDYASPGGTDIQAAARGFVKFVGSAGAGWGQVLVVEHEDQLTTHYIHTDPAAGISTNVEVQRAQKIGDTSAISAAHLHLGLRVTDYQPPAPPDNINYSIRGRLPEVQCTTAASPTYAEKAFSYYYVDTEMMDW